MRPSTIDSTRGFSLVEVLVAMGVLAVGMVATFPLITYASQRSTLARRESNALLAGQGILEQLRSEARYNYGGAALGPDMTTPLTGSQSWNAGTPPLSPPLLTLPTLPGNRRAVTSCIVAGSAGIDANAHALYVEREGEIYTVCYEAQASVAAGACPGASCMVDVNMKVLWLGPDGTPTERRLSTTLQGM